MNIHREIDVFILAGGRSSRFGSDKSLHRFKGKPLIEHVLDAVRPLVSSVSIIAVDSARFDYLNLPCHGDIIEGLGPIGGIHTALTLRGSGHVLILGCDTPFLNNELLSYIISIRTEGDIVIPYYLEMFEPLHAIYSTTCLPAVEKAIGAGRRQVMSFFGDVNVRKVTEGEIRQFTDPGVAFKNINYPHDLPGNPMS